jgi:serine/threonine protein kinase/tetratricopeptide (TPR) repeat protein
LLYLPGLTHFRFISRVLEENLSMTHDASNWDTLQSLFHLAESNPTADLDSLLEHACLDPDLRSRARSLILTAREAARLAAQKGAPSASTAPQGRDGRTRKIGPYSIVRTLGSGGIGTVYLVERIAGGVVQRAALKVLSLHAAGPFFADRFAREQHILASLEHPHVTRMLDAGLSEAGEPYLVMEYVDGVHLDTFCDDRSLGIPARLQLFLQACEAVAYAHRNLVVHLDLKPSNILVTELEGNVKLLDFGTSKLIQPDSLLTTTVMATPAYASPEQLRNEAVTTACDVYALGAILFELLSGRRPNQDSSVAIMIERSIKELPPEPITGVVTPEAAAHRGLTQTRLLNLLRGDLATIVAKCISPRPRDRYASVDALITDVQRYLAGRPILGRPQTTTYRMTKFVRRNRKAVIAGVFAVMALMATSSYALWRQEQAVRAGQRAMQMQNFMYQLFKLANSNYTGKPAATVPEFLQLGVTVIPQFIRDPKDQRAAQLSLAESMFDDHDFSHAQPVLLSVIANSKAAGDLATEAESEAFAGAAAQLLGQAGLSRNMESHAMSLAHAPGVTPTVRVWIESFYAEDEDTRGFRTDATLRLHEDAVNESVAQHLPEREQASAMFNLASTLSFRGRPNDAEPWAKRTLAIYAKESYALCDRADVSYLLGQIEYARGNYGGSIPMYLNAQDGYKTCAGPESPNVLALNIYMARADVKLGQAKAAIQLLEAVLPSERKVAPSGANVFAPLVMLARAYNMDGQFVKAEAAISEAIQLQQSRINPLGPQAAASQLVLAQALTGLRQNAAALAHVRAADSIYSANTSLTPSEKEFAGQAQQLVQELQTKAAPVR